MRRSPHQRLRRRNALTFWARMRAYSWAYQLSGAARIRAFSYIFLSVKWHPRIDRIMRIWRRIEDATYYLNRPLGAMPYPQASLLDWLKAAPAKTRERYRTHLIMSAYGIKILDIMKVFQEINEIQDSLNHTKSMRV